MVCYKCGYIDEKEIIVDNVPLCSLCAFFSPSAKEDFLKYIEEKVDWKLLETFRKYGQKFGIKQKEGMEKKAEEGKVMSRAPLGYDLLNGKLVENQDSHKVHSIFKEFLETDISLNSLAKKYSLSINGLKKILTNRTYLGEIKFDGRIFKGEHKPLISPEIFYAVQRKLKEKTSNFYKRKEAFH
ncbi:MAG: recombinase family protein [Candidatus Pacearchaeota archaeon]